MEESIERIAMTNGLDLTDVRYISEWEYAYVGCIINDNKVIVVYSYERIANNLIDNMGIDENEVYELIDYNISFYNDEIKILYN